MFDDGQGRGGRCIQAVLMGVDGARLWSLVCMGSGGRDYVLGVSTEAKAFSSQGGCESGAWYVWRTKS